MNINLISPINQLGYGVVGLNVVKHLSESVNLSLWPIGNTTCPVEYQNVIESSLNNAKKPDFDAPCIRIWHQFDMSQFVGRGKRIVFPIFELDTFNDIEKHHLSSLDHLFVCSNWAKGVVEENIPTLEGHISVIPLGVDQSIFQPDISRRSETVFFNCGKWEIRKGHDVLVEAFNQAFSEEDNVELWMMCENPFYSPEENLYWGNLYKQSKLGDKIRIIPRQETQKEVYNIMRQVDCGVFLSRAEGWNLELLELMACGKHVIATDYSGHSQFCNKDNSLLVHIDEKESAVDNKWFFGEGEWAKIGHKQIQEAVYYMSMIHRAKKDGRLSQDTLTKSVIETAQQFSWKNTAKEIVNAIAQQK